VGTGVLAAVGLADKAELSLVSEGQDEQTGNEAGLRETVRFVHDVAGRITGSRENTGPEASR
jgi:predicted transcriptional regulator